MAFRFSLATVLRFRNSVERREELALQKILMEIARARMQIEELTAQIGRAQESMNKALLRPITAFQLQSMLSEANVAVERKKALIASLAALERQREVQMQAYQAAHRDRQMLSDMAAKQRDAYELKHARAQQRFLDDVFAARAQRG
jgi:flagellar export protein FliJ